MSKLIESWNTLQEQKKKLNAEEKALKKEIKEAGYIIDGKKVIENKSTLGIFWDLNYANHYVGEKGMYRDITKGAEEISATDYAELENLLRSFVPDESEEIAWSVAAILCNYIPLGEYVFENTIVNGEVTIKEDHIKWITNESGTNDGQMSPDSYFEIKKTTLVDIKNVKRVFEEDVCYG